MLAQVCLCSCLCPDHGTRTRPTHTANCQYKRALGGGCQIMLGKHRPLTRYEKSWVAHAPGMSGTFSPPPSPNETASHARAVMHIGIVIRGGGKNVPCIPGACAARSFTYLAKAHCVNMGALTAFVTCIIGRCLLRMPCVVLHHCVFMLTMVFMLHKKSRILLPCLTISCFLYSIHKYVSYTVYRICLFYVFMSIRCVRNV